MGGRWVCKQWALHASSIPTLLHIRRHHAGGNDLLWAAVQCLHSRVRAPPPGLQCLDSSACTPVPILQYLYSSA